MKTFYILGTGQDGMGKKEGLYILIADDGEFLASHFCSHACYADGDLWKNRPERKEKWEKRNVEWAVSKIERMSAEIKQLEIEGFKS